MPELVGTGSIADGVSGRWAMKYSETDAITAGVAYVNGLKADFEPTHHAEAKTLAGKASSLTVAVGGKLYFDLEGLRYLACEAFRSCALAPATPYLAVNAGPRLKFNSPSDEPLWRLDGVGQVSVGLQSAILGVDASQGTALGPWPLTAPPGEPTNVHAQPGNESATISWHAPEKNPASPLDGEPPCACKEVSNYTVLINGEEREVTGTEITIPNLTNGKTYTMTVRSNADPGKPFDSRETEPITVTPEGMSPFPKSYTMTVDGSMAGYEGEDAGLNNVLGADVTITGTRTGTGPNEACATASYCEYRTETMTGTDYGYNTATAIGGDCSFPFTVNNIVAEPYSILDAPTILVLGESDGVIKGALQIDTFVRNQPECYAGLGLHTEGADVAPWSSWPLSQTVSPGAETSTWSVESPFPELGIHFDGVIAITWHW
jgi:hypothetical protein